jgi:hypothetical protein
MPRFVVGRTVARHTIPANKGVEHVDWWWPYCSCSCSLFLVSCCPCPRCCVKENRTTEQQNTPKIKRPIVCNIVSVSVSTMIMSHEPRKSKGQDRHSDTGLHISTWPMKTIQGSGSCGSGSGTGTVLEVLYF